MRKEDIDWKIYHIIVAGEKCLISDLIEGCGIERQAVLESLKRLDRNCLIKIDDEYACILSLQETILKNSMRSAVQADDSPVIIENGIIKPNPDYKGSFQ